MTDSIDSSDSSELSDETLKLFDDIEFEDLNEIRQDIEDGADVNAVFFPETEGSSVTTPLSDAILHRRPEVILILLQNGADPNLSLDYGMNYGMTDNLTDAILSGDLDIFRHILAYWNDPNLPNNNMYPLRLAIQSENLEMVERLLQAGANPNGVDNSSIIPLFDAIEKRNLGIVKALIDNYADLSLTQNGITAEQYATQMNFQPFFELLENDDMVIDNRLDAITLSTGKNIEIDPSCLQNPQKQSSGYYLKKVLGSGAFGVVAQGCKLSELENDCNYAIKILDLEKPPYSVSDNADQFRSETRAHKKLWRKYKIGPRFYGGWICQDANIAILVLDMWDDSLASPRTLTLRELEKLFDQIQKIHSEKLIHLDIAGKNILIKLDGGTIKDPISDITLTDFGLMTTLYRMEPRDISTFIRYHQQFAPTYYQKLRDIIDNRPIDSPLENNMVDLFQNHKQLFDYGFLAEIVFNNPKIYQKQFVQKLQTEIQKYVPEFQFGNSK